MYLNSTFDKYYFEKLKILEVKLKVLGKIASPNLLELELGKMWIRSNTINKYLFTRDCKWKIIYVRTYKIILERFLS